MLSWLVHAQFFQYKFTRFSAFEFSPNTWFFISINLWSFVVVLSNGNALIKFDMIEKQAKSCSRFLLIIVSCINHSSLKRSNYKTMKYLYLLIGLFLSGSVNAQLEGYSLIDSTSEWHTSGVSAYFDIANCNQNFAYAYVNQSYYIQGDTTIGNHTYYKVYTERLDSNVCTNNTSIFWTNFTSGLTRLMREEDNKLYLYNSSNEEEYLFRDYNIAIGDNLNSDCTVGSIDTLFLLNQPYLKYNCDCNTEFLIQAAGTKRGPFDNLSCGTGIEGDRKNLCYKKNGFVIHIDSTSNCINTGDSSIYVSTYDHLTTKMISKAYPNPTPDIFNIELSKPMSGFYKLYALDGRKVKTGNFKNTNQLFVDISRFQKGIYFLILHSENGRMVDVLKVMRR